MITIYPYETLGAANYGWLDARYHFSFANYNNPKRLGFGKLLVINDDIIASGKGFPSHPHSNMEIITYVRKGAITHKDSMGNEGRTEAGDLQVMNAGKGIFHSEYNMENIETQLYQIWIRPNKENVEPRWDARKFPKQALRDGELKLLVSGREEDNGKNALKIYQDAAIYGGNLDKDTAITQSVKYQAYILVSRGEITINDKTIKQGDGAEITDEKLLTIVAKSDCEILVIDVPA